MPIPRSDLAGKPSLARSGLPVAQAAATTTLAVPHKKQQQQQPPLAFVSSSRSKRRLPLQSLSAAAVTTTTTLENTAVPKPPQQHLILVGGGHAHVQVIKALNKQARPEHLQVTLIDAQTAASYSGMVPGTICDLYTPDQTLLDLVALADWAGLEFVHDRVIDIDLEHKKVYLASSTNNDNAQPNSLSFDCISLDIGSTARGLDVVPGALTYSIPTRPIDKLIQRLDRARVDMLEQADQEQPNNNEPNKNLVVIGGGAAGIELALAVSSRWRHDFPHLSTTLLDAGHELLPNESPAARQKLRQILQEQNICVQHHCQVLEITDEHVILQQQDQQQGAAEALTRTVELPYSECIWAAGAGAHPLARHLNHVRGLDATDRGWFTVNPSLQSTSHPFVFAAGDCCHILNLVNGSPAKAGVYAVRSGPVLIENLTRYLDSLQQEQKIADDDWTEDSVKNVDNDKTADKMTLRPLINYEPQDDFLKLLVCGEGKALGFRFGLAFYGKWVMKIKDTIDQSFMSLFSVDHLPDHSEIKRGDYDTQQYDAKEEASLTTGMPSAAEAAVLLQRTDDDVDYREAFRVLKRMARDVEYQQAILDHVEQQQTTTSGDVPAAQ